MQQILFIDRRGVQDYSVFVNSVNSDTFPIVYDESTDSDRVLALLAENQMTHIERIAFVFHGPSNKDATSLFVPTFLLGEPFFVPDDIITQQPHTLDQQEFDFPKTYSSNVSFVSYLIQQFSVRHLDFLACNLLLLEDWKSYFQLFPSPVIIGASDDKTGNLKYGGDWIIESTMEDIQRIYFTDAIQNYTYLLAMPTAVNTYYHTFYTVSSKTLTIMNRITYDNSGANILDSTDISFGGMNVVDVLQIMDGGGTNPYAIGIVDSSFNKVSMDIAYCSAYTKALTATQRSRVMNYVNTTFKEPHTAATIYTVTVSGGVYWFTDGSGTAMQQPSLLLVTGSLYVFDQSHSTNSGNTLRISTNNISLAEYTSGVVINGTPGSLNAYTLIDVSGVTPTTLYYYKGVVFGGDLYTSSTTTRVETNVTSVEISTPFTVSFYSSAPFGTSISYTISGCVAADLGLSSLTGSFTAPQQEVTFTAQTGGKTLTISCGNSSVNVTITSPPVKYVTGSVQQYFSGDTVGYNPITNPITNTMAYSYNGNTWFGLGKNIFSIACLSVAYGVINGSGIWVAGGVGENQLAYSSDGINWNGLGSGFWGTNSNYPFAGYTVSSSGTQSFAQGCMRVKFMNGRFVATGANNIDNSDNGILYHSTDGINWTKIALIESSPNFSASHDADWTGYGWVFATYSNIYYILDTSFNNTAYSPISPYNVEVGMCCACVTASGGEVKIYIPKIGTYLSTSSSLILTISGDVSGGI